ncbi:fungal-specific transcription factor domain-containing protein [Lactifluus volemus]|nr:fungal-specific transcription factor domain-containing protein [Lactifluus volemus]
MRRRIRELEQGLSEVYATVSNETHPLLVEEHRMPSSAPSSNTPITATPSPMHPDPSVHEADVINSFGTLSIGKKGDSCFYGATAREENTRQNFDASYFRRTRLNERILSVPFPEASPELIPPDIRQMVYGHLPPFEDARGACELFMNYSSYMTSSLTREELLHILEIAYHNKSADPEPATHHLGLLFIVLALSRLLYGENNDTVDSHDYFVLSRVALTLDSPVATTTVTAVQTIVYMAEYLELSDVHIDPTSCDRAWMYIGIAMKLAHSIGLHLGGQRFRLGQREIKRRDRVFWHLFSTDTWASFTSGRPPSTSLGFVDCNLPDDNEAYVGNDGERSWARWNYEFIKLLSQVMATAFTSRPPPYAAILDLDRKLRDFDVPAHLKLQWTGQMSSDSLFWIKRWVVLSNKEWALLNIHRAYFTQALRENPHDPLRHRYGLSVMALYRSAFRLVEGCSKTFQACPPNFPFFRTNFASSKMLSVVIVMRLLVTSAPKSNLAMPALDILNNAVALLEAGIESGSTKNMEAVRNLHREAREAVGKALRPDAAGVTFSSIMSEHLATDYRAVSGLEAPTPSHHVSAYSYAPPDPQLVQQVEMARSGASIPRVFPGQEDFGVPVGQDKASGGTGSLYILDASWEDFVAQLGF